MTREGDSGTNSAADEDVDADIAAHGCSGPVLRLLDTASSRGSCAGDTTAEALAGSSGAQLSTDADDDDEEAVPPAPVALCLDCDAPRARTTTAAALP